jgi:hypothetical protein
MGLVGADIDRLRALVAQLGGPMQVNLNGVLAEMNDQVQASGSYWVAEDGDRFRAGFAAFVQSVKTQLDNCLAGAAKTAGQNLQAIGNATGEATGGQTAGAGNGTKPLSFWWTTNFIPNPGNLVPNGWSRALSPEFKTATIGTLRFAMSRYMGQDVPGLLNIRNYVASSDELPDWAATTRSSLGVASVVLSVVGQGITTYRQDEADHPTWSAWQVWGDTAGQAVVIGGSTGGMGWALGKAGGELGRKVAAQWVPRPGVQGNAPNQASTQSQTAEQAAEPGETATEAPATAEVSTATAEESSAAAASMANATAEEATQASQAAEAALTEAEQESEQAGAEISTEGAAPATAETGTAEAGTAEAGTAEAGTVEAGTVEGGTEAVAEAGTATVVEAGAATVGEGTAVAVGEGVAAELAEGAVVGALAGSEVPILGNVVGLVVGLAFAAGFAFVGSKLGTAIGHTIWNVGDDVFHDIF